MAYHPAAVAAARKAGVTIEQLWSCNEQVCHFRIYYALLKDHFSSRPQQNAEGVECDIWDIERDLENIRHSREMSLGCWRAYVKLKRQLSIQKEKLRKVIELEDIARRIVRDGKAESSQWESRA